MYGPTVIELSGVRKSFGDFTAVSGVSLAVPAGSIFGLLGPNGAGKTTTIRMLMDILAPDGGTIHLFGRERRPEDLRRIGYLPEERGLYPKMQVLEQLTFLARLRGLAAEDARAKAEAWLERVGLAEWKERKVEELSKGMQQKVQLAATVIHDPDILILDEPFSGLDPINQGLFKDLLSDYQQRGKAILFSTHIMEQAQKLCDRLCLISKGRAVLEGELASIQRRYGGPTFRVEAAGDLAWAANLPGVEQVITGDDHTTLMLADDAEPAAILRALTERTEVHEFRSQAPELEEIFIRAVREAD